MNRMYSLLYIDYILKKISKIHSKMYVKTCISIPKEQDEFLRKFGYSPSRLFQNQIIELMKESEGQDVRSQPTDESSGDSNG